MNSLILWLLTWTGNASALVAIGCLSYHIRGEIAAFWDSRYEDMLEVDNSVWLAFAFMGVWMACEIGRIGV